MSLSTMMSAPSRQIELFETLDISLKLSSAALLAKTLAAPIPKAKASKGQEAASISKPSELSEKSALVGLLLKTALISELGALTPCSLRWRHSATPANRLWLVLETSEPTTSGSDLGLSGSTPTKLPTPMASDGMRDGKGGGAGSTYPFRRILGTPTANSAPRGSVLRKMKGAMNSDQDDFDRTPTASEAIYFHQKEMLSTPRASDMKAGGHGDTGRMGTVRHQLRRAAETLPTPTKRDKRDKRMDACSPAYDKRKSPTMDAVLDGAMTDRSPDKWAYARQIAATLQSAGLTGPSMTLPITYGWMQGYPPGWLARALRSAVQKGHLLQVSSLKRSAIPSSRKSQKQLGEQS